VDAAIPTAEHDSEKKLPIGQSMIRWKWRGGWGKIGAGIRKAMAERQWRRNDWQEDDLRVGRCVFTPAHQHPQRLQGQTLWL